MIEQYETIVMVRYGSASDPEDISLYLVSDDLQAAKVARAKTLAHYQEHYLDAGDDETFAGTIRQLIDARTTHDIWGAIYEYVDIEYEFYVTVQIAEDLRTKEIDDAAD